MSPKGAYRSPSLHHHSSTKKKQTDTGCARQHIHINPQYNDVHVRATQARPQNTSDRVLHHTGVESNDPRASRPQDLTDRVLLSAGRYPASNSRGVSSVACHQDLGPLPRHRRPAPPESFRATSWSSSGPGVALVLLRACLELPSPLVMTKCRVEFSDHGVSRSVAVSCWPRRACMRASCISQ